MHPLPLIDIQTDIQTSARAEVPSQGELSGRHAFMTCSPFFGQEIVLLKVHRRLGFSFFFAPFFFLDVFHKKSLRQDRLGTTIAPSVDL